MHIEAVPLDQRRAFPAPKAFARPAPEPELDRFLALPDVVRLTTLSRAEIYRRMAAGTFPKAISLSRLKVAWSARAIAQWQEAVRRNSETVSDNTANSGAQNAAGELVAA
jgi:prophage regulatory protein